MQSPARWYHEPYTWLVFGLPAATIIACMITIALAINSADGLVIDDYYKQGLEINRTLEREQLATTLGLDASFTLNTPQTVQMHLKAAAGFAWPERLNVLFAHATRPGQDQWVPLVHIKSGEYRGALEPLAAGAWHIDVSTPEWRIIKRMVISAATAD